MHPQNRDVAQLVAHYVRDVGVGRSSRLIPTDRKNKGGRRGHLCFFLFSLLYPLGGGEAGVFLEYFVEVVGRAESAVLGYGLYLPVGVSL